MHIREMNHSDAPHVEAIIYEAFKNKFTKLIPYDDDQMKILLQDIGFFNQDMANHAFVAEHHDQVIGVITLKWHGLNEPAVSVRHLLKNHGIKNTFKISLLGIVFHNKQDEDECYIENVGVAPSARGLGAGTKLIDYAYNFAQTKGFKKLTLHVVASNTRAKSLYERLGFKTLKINKSAMMRYAIGEDSASFMAKPI